MKVEIDLVSSANVVVVECGRGFGFALETFTAFFIAQQMRRQKLQRHGPIDLRIFGLVNNTHPPFTELLCDAVVGDGLADHVGPFYRLTDS